MARTPAGRSARSGPPPVQDLPAEPAVARRQGREEPEDREFLVVGPKRVGGCVKGELVTLRTTRAAADALIQGGHVVPAQDRPPVADSKEVE